MKKLLVLLLMMIFMLTACHTNPDDTVDNINLNDAIGNILSSGESKKIKQMSTDILTCITENDKESFKKLFCEETQNSPDFDEQVDKAFEYCKGTVYFTDSTIDTIASGGSSRDHGTRTEWHVNPDIPYFEVLTDTDSGEKESRYYAIHYRWQITYESDKTKEGLYYLKIELLNVDSMRIGE